MYDMWSECIAIGYNVVSFHVEVSLNGQMLVEGNVEEINGVEFAKENITIFEMKQADATLEDAFMKLIEGGEK